MVVVGKKYVLKESCCPLAVVSDVILEIQNTNGRYHISNSRSCSSTSLRHEFDKLKPNL